MKRRSLQTIMNVALLSSLACACSSSASDSPATAGDGSASDPPSGDGQAFVPSTIPFKSLDEDLSTQYKLVSATVRDYGNYMALLVSVRNDSGAFLCSPTFNALLKTATTDSGQEVRLSSAMYQASYGSAEPCLEPGAVGYGANVVDFDVPVKLSEITSVVYEPRGTLDPQAPTKITNVELSGLALKTLAGGGQGVIGRLVNHGNKPLGNVMVSYFALDSGDRPYDFDTALTETPLAAGATWEFTLPNISSIGKHVAFAEFVFDQP